LCISSFLLSEYYVEYLIEYSGNRLMPKVAIAYMVVQNKGQLFPHSYLLHMYTLHNYGFKRVKIMPEVLSKSDNGAFCGILVFAN